MSREVRIIKDSTDEFYFKLGKNQLGLLLKKEEKEEHVLMTILEEPILTFEKGIVLDSGEKKEIEKYRDTSKKIKEKINTTKYEIEFLY